MADLATQDAPFGLNRLRSRRVRVADRLFEGEEAVLHVMDRKGRGAERGTGVVLIVAELPCPPLLTVVTAP
jgi:hypothetical protein